MKRPSSTILPRKQQTLCPLCVHNGFLCEWRDDDPDYFARHQLAPKRKDDARRFKTSAAANRHPADDCEQPLPNAFDPAGLSWHDFYSLLPPEASVHPFPDLPDLPVPALSAPLPARRRSADMSASPVPFLAPPASRRRSADMSPSAAALFFNAPPMPSFNPPRSAPPAVTGFSPKATRPALSIPSSVPCSRMATPTPRERMGTPTPRGRTSTLPAAADLASGTISLSQLVLDSTFPVDISIPDFAMDLSTLPPDDGWFYDAQAAWYMPRR